MEFRILGPLQARAGDRDLAPRRAKTRALLGYFLLHRNELVPPDRLIEALWGEEPPATAGKALQGHVSALRKLLGETRIRTERGSYRFEVAPGELDLDRFEAALSAARAERNAGARAKELAAALEIWPGPALPDLSNERFAQAALARLEGVRLGAVEDWADAELGVGRHVAILAELEPLVRQQPLHEGLRGKLMLALYRAGRQSDALRVYREGRRHLAEELGIDPGADLQRLEQQILAQDPVLETPSADGQAATGPRQERRVVTLLVAEATPAKHMDPEDIERLVAPALERVRDFVHRHGGTAEPLFANALVGIFGAPRTHDDDALRAVRAAWELRDDTSGGDLQLRIGIETGEALVTMDGGHVAVAGQVLAAAAHLQAAAEAGAARVGTSAHRATEAAIEYRAAPTGGWVVIGPRTTATIARHEAPFIGRGDELALLGRLFRRARDDGTVQLATITAEAGGGKSRLVAELRSLLESSPGPPAWRQGRCLPYGEGITYWALGEVVKAQAGILESDDPAAAAGKLLAAVERLEPDETRRSWLERSLAPLVGIDGAAAPGDRHQSFVAWRQFLESIAAQRPLVVAIEDIHWADPALLEFLEHLAASAGRVPLLLICTARLELLAEHPRWAGGRRNATTIALEPLSTADTERLLQALMGRSPEPPTVRRASGNPLFAHELAMLDTGAVGPSTDVPESLRGVIAARLDSLAPELKALAADAAVVGEVFWSGALSALAQADDSDIEARLQGLAASDVAREHRSTSVARQREYAFLHVLVRDVAYGRIPRRERIPKHRAVAQWIQQLAGDRSTSHAELVAHHYGEALTLARGLGDEVQADELRPRTREALQLAGEHARTVELAQAESYYRRALDLTEPGDPARGSLLGRLGELAELTGRLADAEGLCRRAIADLEANGDLLGAGEALVVLVAVLWRLGTPEKERRRLAIRAVRTLEVQTPGPALVRAYARMATHELHAGRARACGTWSRRALALAEDLGEPALQVQPLHHLGIARFETGDDAGIEDIREALRIGLAAGLSWETAVAHTNLAATVWVTEGPLPALKLKREAATFAASRGLDALERTIRAESLWQLHDGGLWDDALQLARELLAAEGHGASSRITTMARTVMARILADRGRTREATEVEGAYLPRARELGDPQDLGPALAAAAALRLALGDPGGAADLIAELEMVTRARDQSQRVHELPFAARVGLASDTIAVAEALIPVRGAPTYKRARLCLTSGQALAAEGRGELQAAAALHGEAAAGWEAFGNPAEAAWAQIGHGRCLIALGREADAIRSLRAAKRMGRRLRAVGIVAEAELSLAAAARERAAAALEASPST